MSRFVKKEGSRGGHIVGHTKSGAPIYGGAPRSPGRGDTIKSLRILKESGYHNPDTGTELQPEESDAHLMMLEQRRADKVEHTAIKKLVGARFRSRGRPWIPSNGVVFRNIGGHIVPFGKPAEEPWL